MYEWSTLSSFISGNKLVFLRKSTNESWAIFGIFDSQSCWEYMYTGDIVMSVKGFANSTIIVIVATEVAM